VTAQPQQYPGQRPARQPAAAGRGRVTRSLPQAPQRYGQWAGTILFIVVVALAAGWLYTSKGGTTEVLVLDKAVAPGQVIEEADLGSAQVAGVEDAIGVVELGEVVGKRASIGLVPGQVLTHGALSAEPVPGPQQRMVAVRLDQGRVPETLTAGTVVNLVAVPPTGDTGNQETLDNPAVITENAKVYAITKAVDGSYVVSLLVPESAADRVAAYGAAGRVTVVQAPVAGE